MLFRVAEVEGKASNDIALSRRSAGPFLWFGGLPGERIPSLGEKIATHTKHNADREKSPRMGHRVVAKSRFVRLETIDAVIQKLIVL